MWNAWGQLLHTVRTGENAFRHLHGKDTWQCRADDAEESQIFDAAMRESSARSAAEVLSNYDFTEFSHIVDVGGGDGTLLAAILAQCPKARGTLLDLPHVVGGAEADFAGAEVAVSPDRITAFCGAVDVAGALIALPVRQSRLGQSPASCFPYTLISAPCRPLIDAPATARHWKRPQTGSLPN